MLTLKRVELWANCAFLVSVDTPSPVVLWECDIQSLSQRWQFQNGGGVIRLVNNSSLFTALPWVTITEIYSMLELCLEIPNSDDTDGVQLKTNTCNGGKNQIWYLA